MRQGWKTPGELGINNFVECDSFSLQCSNTIGSATGRASRLQKVGCRFVGGQFDWSFARLTPPPPSPLAPIKSRMETLWYRLIVAVP